MDSLCDARRGDHRGGYGKPIELGGSQWRRRAHRRGVMIWWDKALPKLG